MIMTILDAVEIAIGLLMLVFAVLSLHGKKIMTGVIFLSILSLFAVVAFVLMQAPDVAITEAVIGSGLSTALFVFTLAARKGKKEEGDT